MPGSPTGPGNDTATPIEIGRRPLRILLILFIANFAALIAVALLAARYIPWLRDGGGVLVALITGVGILTLAVVCAPPVAFLVHTKRSTTSITPRLRRSALASAVPPAVVGLWCAMGEEGGVGLVVLGVVLILLATAVIVRAFTVPRAAAGANQFVLRPEASFVGVVLVALAAGSQPHGPTPAQSYRTAMKSDLRNLVTVQERFFDRTQRYQTNPAVLQFVPSHNVHAPTISLSDSGWRATNTHSRLRGMRCGVAIKTTNPVNAAAKDGEPACTDSLVKR